jgi:hypothetical protein
MNLYYHILHIRPVSQEAQLNALKVRADIVARYPWLAFMITGDHRAWPALDSKGQRKITRSLCKISLEHPALEFEWKQKSLNDARDRHSFFFSKGKYARKQLE